MLAKVLYSEIHGGDYLTILEVEKIQAEVDRLQSVHLLERVDEECLREFEGNMRELIACSLEIKKPIVF